MAAFKAISLADYADKASKPYGVTAGRLWLEAHMSRLDPKIGDPYATQVMLEIDHWVARALSQAYLRGLEDAAMVADRNTGMQNTIGRLLISSPQKFVS